MELILTDDTKSTHGMKLCNKVIFDTFKDTINLVKYWGPVQMCVFYLEYNYSPNDYKIIIECERGIITIEVINKDKNIFSPWMIYPESRYYHYEDVDNDIYQLITLTHKAITENETKFIARNTIGKFSKGLR